MLAVPHLASQAGHDGAVAQPADRGALAGAQLEIEHQVPLHGKTTAERDAIVRQLAERHIAVVPTMVVAYDSLLAAPDDARAIVDGTRRDPQRALVAAYTLADWREQLAERRPGLADLVQPMLAGHLAALRDMHRAGVTLAPGTDGGVLLIYPGYSLHRELALMVDQLEMTPMEAAPELASNDWK